MLDLKVPLIFEQIHIDVVRNSTDDFNLFHDPDRWHRIQGNPFKGPIALGFQLESLIEHAVLQYRKENTDQQLIEKYHLGFSNYQFTFANAVKAYQEIQIDIKKTQFKQDPEFVLSNRISIKSNAKLALIGYKKESQQPLFLPSKDFSQWDDLRREPDRAFLSKAPSFFLKRKFMNVSNAKNFLCGSLAKQADYFDELEDIVYFPEIFPSSLISCALLEKALIEGHDFERNPMVYTAHKISVDKAILKQLKSNEVLHILLEKVVVEVNEDIVEYHCYGLLKNNTILFRAIINLCPLSVILKKNE